MSIKAAVKYVECRLNARKEELLYRTITSEYIAVLTRNERLKQTISFYDEIKKIYDFGKVKEDNRTAKEIVEDTFQRIGIKIVD